MIKCWIIVAFMALGIMTSSKGWSQTFYDGMQALSQDDFITAQKIWMPLALKGDAKSQTGLGYMYENGFGVSQDYKEAVRWYKLAANKGLADTQMMLGSMYDRGLGVPQDYKEAVRLYKLAANQGDADAQNALGWMYSEGRGVLQNVVLAHMWFNISASNGAKSAAPRRDDIVRSMTPADISRAQEMARRCVASGYKECD